MMFYLGFFLVLISVGVIAHIEPRIIGGFDADVMQYPFFAHVFWNDKGDIYRVCGGSLISTNHVVTAAHCISTNQDKEIVVALQLYNLDNTENAEFHNIQNITIHPEFNKSDNVWADIAILQLEKPTQINYIEIKQTKKEETASIIGYGENYTKTKIMKEIVLPIVSHRECHNYYFTYGIPITKDLICVQNGDFFSSPCKGDSGGPLLIRKKNIYISSVLFLLDQKFVEEYLDILYLQMLFYIDWINEVINFVL